MKDRERAREGEGERMRWEKGLLFWNVSESDKRKNIEGKLICIDCFKGMRKFVDHERMGKPLLHKMTFA